MVEVIVYCGYPKVGKDYLAKKLIEKGYKRLAFADILKEQVSKHYDIELEYFHDVNKKDNYIHNSKTLRELLISFAENRRKEDIHYFVDHVISKMKNDGKYVITDGRFHNELWRMKKTFGDKVKIYWIKRDGYSKGNDSIEIVEADCDETIINS